MPQTTNPDIYSSDFSQESAQAAFIKLVNDLRASSLWFFKKDLPLDINDHNAPIILKQCALHCNRTQWILIRKLRKWLSHNIR